MGNQIFRNVKHVLTDKSSFLALLNGVMSPKLQFFIILDQVLTLTIDLEDTAQQVKKAFFTSRSLFPTWILMNLNRLKVAFLPIFGHAVPRDIMEPKIWIILDVWLYR